MREVCGILLASIHYALDHREEAVQYALQFGRGMGAKLVAAGTVKTAGEKLRSSLTAAVGLPCSR